MHHDRELAERRIARELWERVLPLVHVDRRELAAHAGPDLDHLAPIAPREPWGAPWATTWFRFTGEVPEAWAGRRVEAVIDLGFSRAGPGFQCEGLVVDLEKGSNGVDGRWRPVHGLHPRRTHHTITSGPGPVTVHVEAASNPSFPQFRPSPLGDPTTLPDRPIYRYGHALLVVVDPEAEALAHDLDVADDLMRSLPPDDPMRARWRAALMRALDEVPDVAAARRALADLLARPGAPGRHRIVATGHAHIDTAWLWPVRETVRKCVRTFSSAVRLLDDDPDFVFSCSQARQYAWIEERHPELFADISRHVADGRWVPVGGMWVESDMNLPSAESLVRQIVVGQRWFEERFGVRCREMWIPDVFGYPAGLPQLFAAGGMRRFVTQKLSWNQQNRFPHHTFWWEGLDGTRVLTHFPPVDTYNAEVTPTEIAHSMARFREHGWSDVSLLPFGFGDGGGGPTREMLERAHRLADLDPRATVEIGTPSDVFDAVERGIPHGAAPPVWRGELYIETHRGTLTSQLRTKLGNRRCERLLVEAELWSATLSRPADLDDLWRDVLTEQFHDILPGSSIAWVHDDAEATFARVGAELEERIADLLAHLADVVGEEVGEEVGEHPSGLAVANRADVPIGGVLVVDDPDLAGRAAALPGTQPLPDGATAIAAEPVAALSVGGLVPADATDRVVVTASSLSNGHLAIRLDERGRVVSVIDVARARELVVAGEAIGPELAVDHPVEYDAWDVEAWTRRGGRSLPGRAEVTVDASGPLVGRVTATWRFGPSTLAVTHELRAGERELRLAVDLDWQHDEHLLSMSFPVDVAADTAACDVQLGVVHRPTHASSPWDAAKFEVCAHRYVSVAEPSFGVAVLNDGRYGHGLLDGAIRVSLARAARYPDPDADRGHHRVTLAVRPHDGDLADVRAAATRLDRPPRIVAAGAGSRSPGPAGSAGADRPIVTVDVEDGTPGAVEVDAVKQADDGSGDLVVRLHEAVGDRRRITVRAARPVAAASRCDLLEDPERAEEVGDGIVALALRPFELVTLRLTLVDDGR